MDKRPLQDLVGLRVGPHYQQPLKTVEDACAAIGWEFAERPVCCGEPVEIESMLGAAYQATCPHCQRFIYDITAPEFTSPSAVVFVDIEQFDIETAKRWISGQKDTPTPEEARGRENG